MSQSEVLDIAVVGAGPCGIAVGAAAKNHDRRAVLFDRGCITNSIVQYPPYMTFFSTADRLEVGGVPFTIADDKPTRREALVYYRRVVRHYDLDVRQYEEVVDVTGTAGNFQLRTRRKDGSEGHYRARTLVVATGSFHEPNHLGVPGEDLPKVKHYYQDPYPYFDQDVVVVGGRNSAVETALELYRADARVTLVHYRDRLSDGVKSWVLPDIRNRLENGEIDVRWMTRIAEIRPRSVLLRNVDSGEEEELRNDWVLAMTGWRSDPALLTELGVSIDDATGVPAHDPETMETEVPGVYIAGVLAAGNDANSIFIENGRMHGERILSALERDERRLATPAVSAG